MNNLHPVMRMALAPFAPPPATSTGVLITYLIVPAWSDQAGQCRIVCREHAAHIKLGLRDYRDNPDLWREAGLMDSRGSLRCLSATPEQVEDIKSCQPLSAPMTFTYPA